MLEVATWKMILLTAQHLWHCASLVLVIGVAPLVKPSQLYATNGLPFKVISRQFATFKLHPEAGLKGQAFHQLPLRELDTFQLLVEGDNSR